MVNNLTSATLDLSESLGDMMFLVIVTALVLGVLGAVILPLLRIFRDPEEHEPEIEVVEDEEESN